MWEKNWEKTWWRDRLFKWKCWTLDRCVCYCSHLLDTCGTEHPLCLSSHDILESTLHSLHCQWHKRSVKHSFCPEGALRLPGERVESTASARNLRGATSTAALQGRPVWPRLSTLGNQPQLSNAPVQRDVNLGLHLSDSPRDAQHLEHNYLVLPRSLESQ